MKENTNRIEILKKLNYNFSESLNSVEQNKKKIQKLQGQLKSVNKNTQFKHKESQSLIRI